MPFKIVRNDITHVKADVIVNNANPKPIYASGTDLAVYQAAGADELLAERKKVGCIERGDIAVTGAYALNAKYIIHTVGPVWVDGKHEEFETLESCYAKSLQKALELGCDSIAFPFISKGMTGGMSVALKNIINSMYSEDLSKKICAAQKIKAKNGDVVQALVHFGYMKDPNDIHKIIIDPEAAQIVRKIFAYAEEITNASEIARRLNVEKIPSITQYFLNKGIKKNFSGDLDKPHFWTGSSVHMILRNESYKGTYTWGKTDQRLRTQRTMNTRVVDRAESEWVVIENHHEAIIAPEVFDKVQQLWGRKSRDISRKGIKPVKGLNVFRCPYCKRTLSINNKSVSCSRKTVSLNSECNKVFANKDTLEDTVATTINQIAAYAMDCSQKLMKKSRTCDIIEGDIIAYQKELQSIPMLKMRKYDQYKQEKITAEQYQAFVEEVYLKKEQLEDKLNQLYEEQNAMKASYKEAEHTHLLANSMLLRNGYDAEIISRFVKYIDVYSESEIEIVFNVDDVFFKKILDELE